jgi:SNF2 family DNA or RNA helicase
MGQTMEQTLEPKNNQKVTIYDGEIKSFNIICANTKLDLSIRRDGEKLWLDYGYAPAVTNEFKKNFDGMTWHGYKTPPIKQWSIKYCEHNLFRLSFMACLNPYSRFEQPRVTLKTTKPLKQHQLDLAEPWVTTGASLWAAEMGLGKTLAAFAGIEHLIEVGKLSLSDEVFWVAPKSALVSVQLEYIKWCCKFKVRFLTYEGLKKYAETVSSGTIPPRVLVGDESHNIKHEKAQRTICFAHIVRAMRQEHGETNCFIALLTGTPSPKSPLDWYSQCEILCPGFLKEGTLYAFKDRLAIIKQSQGAAGAFPELVTWRDDVTKCSTCGKVQLSWDHDTENLEFHLFKPCVNEVEFLYERMKGLVIVKTKKDCLDLPDKIYRRIYCKPKETVLRAMKMIAKTTESAVKALTLLRELSDGFQYTEVQDGKRTCELCKGSGQYVNNAYVGPEKTDSFLNDLVRTLSDKLTSEREDEETGWGECTERLKNELMLNIESSAYPEDVILDPVDFPHFFEQQLGDCPCCEGAGDVPNIVRSWRDTTTSKDRALIDLLEEHDEVQRVVIYAGFKQSIDRCVNIAKDNDWDYIRLDGRGWESSLEGKPQELISNFQNRNIDKKIAFIGNPGSAGVGLTLTASPSIIYYSNDFRADSRAQSEDRIHRMGMDENRGATIIDLIHLPTDEYVLDNLQKKRRLQDMSLGQLQQVLETNLVRSDYE